MHAVQYYLTATYRYSRLFRRGTDNFSDLYKFQGLKFEKYFTLTCNCPLI